MITWFKNKESEGVASLYSTNITLNATSSLPFEHAYKVRLGKDEEGNLAIEPLDRNRVESGELEESDLYDIAYHKSYSRISSTPLMSLLSETFGLKLSKEAKKYKTHFDNSSNCLIIKIDRKGEPR